MEHLRLSERRVAVDTATEALAGVETCLWEATTADLGPLLRQVDDLARRVESARVAVLTEAIERGETTATVARSHVGWVLEWAPSLRAGGAARLVEVARASQQERNAQLREALLDGRVVVSNAAVCLVEMDRLRHRLRPEAIPTVWEGLLTLAAQDGPRAIRALRPALLARHGIGDELERLEERARQLVRLSQPVTAADGLHEYSLLLDNEGRAVLEAALGPVSAPCPTEAVPDLRSSGQRRADGLLTLVRRAVACPESVPTSPKSTLFVSMDFEALQAWTGRGTAFVRGGTTVGSADAGSLLSPHTIRRLACDGGVIPVVLGTRGEVLDLGREARFFSPGQQKVLWLRDRHCTIPGVRCRLNGRTPVTCRSGPTVGRPTSAMPPCCADTTTLGCIDIEWPGRSSLIPGIAGIPVPSTRSGRSTWSGTCDPGPTTPPQIHHDTSDTPPRRGHAGGRPAPRGWVSPLAPSQRAARSWARRS